MIEIKNITKKFGDFTAIEDISFTVDDCSIYGLIGYNGAGKTTLLKSAAGIYKTDSGSILLNGADSYNNGEVRKKLFYVPDDMYFISNSTIESMAKFYKGMYESFDSELFDKIISIFGLDKRAKIRGLSKGMKRQAEIAYALSTRPKFMLLDEIFDGIDPQKRDICKRLFKEYIADSNCSIIISSHNLSELNELCDRVGIINGKKLTFDCSIDDIPVNNRKFRIVFSDDADLEQLKKLPVSELKTEGKMASFSAIGIDNIKSVREALGVMGILDCNEIPMTLEELFLEEMEEPEYDISKIF